jgi:hypothetical protein
MNPGRRSLYLNLGLTGGLLLLAAVAWFAPETPESRFRPFAHISADTLSRIEILVAQQPPTRLQRRYDGAWEVEGSPGIELDPKRLRNVLNLLSESVAQGYAAEKLALKEFGLQPPPVVLKLDDHAFHFGAREPLSRRRYVLYEGRLYLLADTHYPLLSRGLGNLLRQPDSAPVGGADTNGMLPELPEIEIGENFR